MAPALPQEQPPIRPARRFLSGVWESFFTFDPAPGFAWVGNAWVGVLFLLGVVWWGIFFNWGNFSVDFHDWAEVSAPRIAFVRDAVLTGQFPLHMPDASALRNVTDRFLELPDVITAPQMVLLGLFETQPYILISTLLMYALGAWGLDWFRRKYRLAPLTFGLLFLAFNFNGQVQAHFGVGHVNYVGYYLFPWLAALAIQVIEAPQGWRWIAKVAFLLFLMVLQGAFHHFIWSMMFLGLLALVQWKRLKTIALALVASGFLSAIRLLPPVLGMGQFDNEFLTGYPRPWDYLFALVRLVPPAQAYTERLSHNSLGWWEFDLYLGWIGAAAILFFGVGYGLMRLRSERAFLPLLFPMGAMAALSFWKVYSPIAQIPLLSSERVSARLIILPFAVLILLAAIHFQRWLEKAPRVWPLRVAEIAGVAWLGVDLWRHAQVWKLTEAVKAFPVTPTNLAIKVVSNHADPAYTTVLWVGLALTGVTGAFLIYMHMREHRTAPAPAGNAPSIYPNQSK